MLSLLLFEQILLILLPQSFVVRFVHDDRNANFERLPTDHKDNSKIIVAANETQLETRNKTKPVI